MRDYVIRQARTPDDFRACQDAQRKAWGIDDDSYVVPIATMAGAAHHGGLVLGAFLPSGEAVALSFGFLGRSRGELCLYSQLTGVVPSRQGQGIGLELKTRQLEFARSQAIDSIVWAFDPLQAGNAHFNFEKLRATAFVYIEDMYGPRTDGVNRFATATDRLIVRLSTSPTESRPSPPRERESDVHNTGAAAGADVRTIEIPSSISDLRRTDPQAAEMRRKIVGAEFLDAFAAGYQAVGFVKADHEAGQEPFYVLVRK